MPCFSYGGSSSRCFGREKIGEVSRRHRPSGEWIRAEVEAVQRRVMQRPNKLAHAVQTADTHVLQAQDLQRRGLELQENLPQRRGGHAAMQETSFEWPS